MQIFNKNIKRLNLEGGFLLQKHPKAKETRVNAPNKNTQLKTTELIEQLISHSKKSNFSI